MINEENLLKNGYKEALSTYFKHFEDKDGMKYTITFYKHSNGKYDADVTLFYYNRTEIISFGYVKSIKEVEEFVEKRWFKTDAGYEVLFN